VTHRGRALLAGAGAALAVSLPAALAAQIGAATTDDDLPALLSLGLAAVALLGAILGGWVAARAGGGAPVALAVGALGLGAVALVGVLRRTAADEDPRATVIAAAAGLGAVLGAVGWALARRSAARTRS
jgi:hypothetical protein